METEKSWNEEQVSEFLGRRLHVFRLLTLISDVESAAELQGFVISESPCIIELGAGVQATMQTEG